MRHNTVTHTEPEFHLNTFSGTTFPVAEAVRRVNELIAPGTWTGQGPLTLTQPN